MPLRSPEIDGSSGNPRIPRPRRDLYGRGAILHAILTPAVWPGSYTNTLSRITRTFNLSTAAGAGRGRAGRAPVGTRLARRRSVRADRPRAVRARGRAAARPRPAPWWAGQRDRVDRVRVRAAAGVRGRPGDPGLCGERGDR